MADPTRRPSLTVWDGIAITLGALALLGLCGVAIATPRFEAMFKEFGNAPLPALTKLVLRGGTALRIGAPAGFLIAFVMTFVRRVPPALRLGLALMIAGVAIVWLVALYAPVFALAGNISE
jgi:hypothetical protein